jgi:alpha/beta superfamily hydrolase
MQVESLDGLSLEAEIDEPDQVGGLVVLCHPHPNLGGTMDAPLLLAMRDELVSRGWSVLRFNFRGSGKSDGRRADGVAEVADAGGALSAIRRRHPGISSAIAGWSFGAGVAIRVTLHDDALVACAAIAPPVQEKEGVTAGLPPPREVKSGVPLMVVCGSNDDVVSPASCRAWAEHAGARFELMRGANHFFWAQYPQLAAVVADFLDRRL